jgi:predicted nucleotidyltransferase
MVARIVDVLHPLQIWLCGSRARGEARADSDWDFLAVLPDDAPEQDLDISSVWQRLRDLDLSVEVIHPDAGPFATDGEERLEVLPRHGAQHDVLVFLEARWRRRRDHHGSP